MEWISLLMPIMRLIQVWVKLVTGIWILKIVSTRHFWIHITLFLLLILQISVSQVQKTHFWVLGRQFWMVQRIAVYIADIIIKIKDTNNIIIWDILNMQYKNFNKNPYEIPRIVRTSFVHNFFFRVFQFLSWQEILKIFPICYIIT